MYCKTGFQICLVLLCVAATVGSFYQVSSENLKLVLTSARLPQRGSGQNAVYDGHDSIYIIGGLEDVPLLDVVKYSIGSGQVQVVGRFVPTYLGTAFMDGDHIYNIGGLHNNGSYSTAIYRIETTNFTYDVVNRLPVGCAHLQAAWDSSNHMAYIFGGQTGPVSALNTVVEYNVTSNQVRVIGQLPYDVSELAAAWDPREQVTYLFGGYRFANFSRPRDIVEYDPTLDTIRNRSVLPETVLYPHALYADSGRHRQDVYIFNDYGLIRFNPETNDAQSVPVQNWTSGLIAGGTVYVPKLDRTYIFGGHGGSGGGPYFYRDEIWYIDLGTAPVDCSDGQKRLVPNPFCCESFYLCRDGVPNKYECADSQHFHPIELQWQDASIVECGVQYNSRIMDDLQPLSTG